VPGGDGKQRQVKGEVGAVGVGVAASCRVGVVQSVVTRVSKSSCKRAKRKPREFPNQALSELREATWQPCEQTWKPHGDTWHPPGNTWHPPG
jgi:hypothetical protein